MTSDGTYKFNFKLIKVAPLVENHRTNNKNDSHNIFNGILLLDLIFNYRNLKELKNAQCYLILENKIICYKTYV